MEDGHPEFCRTKIDIQDLLDMSWDIYHTLNYALMYVSLYIDVCKNKSTTTTLARWDQSYRGYPGIPSSRETLVG